MLELPPKANGLGRWLNLRRPRIYGIGEKVILAQPRYCDAQQWLSLRSEGREAFQRREPTWSQSHITKQYYRSYIREYVSARRRDLGYAFFVWDAGFEHLMGACHITNMRRGAAQMATLGYWMGEPYQRNGYMSEAVKLVCIYAFDVLKLHRLEAACMVDNIASCRVLENNLFQYEGRAENYLKLNGSWEDHVLYGRSHESIEE